MLWVFNDPDVYILLLWGIFTRPAVAGMAAGRENGMAATAKLLLGWFVARSSLLRTKFFLVHILSSSMDRLRRDSRALDALFSETDVAAGTSSQRIDVACQLSGHLWKCRTSGDNSWKRRFFVLKDGFLLYYTEKSDDKFLLFDFHPRGVLPLDGCTVQRVEQGPRKDLAHLGIRISHPSFGRRALVLCAETAADRERWLIALENSRYITYKNALEGSRQIERLKGQLVQLQRS